MVQSQRDVGIVQFWDYFPWGDVGGASLASGSYVSDPWKIKKIWISKFLQVRQGQVRDWIKPTFWFSLFFFFKHREKGKLFPFPWEQPQTIIGRKSWERERGDFTGMFYMGMFSWGRLGEGRERSPSPALRSGDLDPQGKQKRGNQMFPKLCPSDLLAPCSSRRLGSGFAVDEGIPARTEEELAAE